METQEIVFEPKKELSYCITRGGYGNVLFPKLKHLYEFHTEHDLENITQFVDRDIREIVIDSLVQEFRFALNQIVYGDPAGKDYVEHIKETEDIDLKQTRDEKRRNRKN